jgi:hypothetical protein
VPDLGAGFEDQEPQAEPAQVPGDRQPGLPAADDGNVHALGVLGVLSCGCHSDNDPAAA